MFKYIFVALISVLLFLNCNQQTPEQKIQNALINLLSKSPEDNRKMMEIHNINISWSIGTIGNNTLAATTITNNGAHIVFDYRAIEVRREFLEPIIAHELDHIHDAFLIYGVDNFIKISNEEKDLKWRDRTLEKSAIKQEDQTRLYLIENYPKEFKGMSPTRIL